MVHSIGAEVMATVMDMATVTAMVMVTAMAKPTKRNASGNVKRNK